MSRGAGFYAALEQTQARERAAVSARSDRRAAAQYRELAERTDDDATRVDYLTRAADCEVAAEEWERLAAEPVPAAKSPRGAAEVRL